MGYRHVVGAMLAVMLCSGISSAESSARTEIEEFFRRATAILTEGTDADRARDEVRELAHALFDGRRAARSALGAEWDPRTGPEREEFARVLRASSYAGLVERLLTMAGAGEPIMAAPRDGARPGDVVVYFDTGRAELGPAGRRDLETAAAWLVANEQARGLVEGHSDQQGESQLNQTL